MRESKCKCGSYKLEPTKKGKHHPIAVKCTECGREFKVDFIAVPPIELTTEELPKKSKKKKT